MPKPHPNPTNPATDDRLTLIALGVLAFALADQAHEALGHGLVTLLIGGKPVLLTTCNFDASGHFNHWVSAAGGLMNLAVGIAALATLRLVARLPPRFRYFLVLTAAFNLFFAFGYPAYSGLARFGDWTRVISVFQPQWPWRLLLVVVAVAGYYASMRLLVAPLAPFAGRPGSTTVGTPDTARLQRITLIPYVAAIVMACAAGALNPKGWLTMLNAGLPAAAAAFGLTQIDNFIVPMGNPATQEVAAPLERSWSWIIVAAAVLIFFIAVLGPGIRFS